MRYETDDGMIDAEDIGGCLLLVVGLVIRGGRIGPDSSDLPN